ncbi:uncharacterized protein F5147DRAFT_655307 [Suillus discolor]|uniref:Uncharacterized protein n=1 Tax=Suillus discolor TaxID=1912936 RepID=A0A9P7F2E7_9AGAM|nr:uncharacterized protein F5147DRAFT_655307 [Suillus discolor]KAG2101326.1 hypothetical protein F5147DRAFT_655307 [Suillus discolor]
MPLDAAAIMSTALEGILYILMFMGSIWALTYKKTHEGRQSAVAAVVILPVSLSSTVIFLRQNQSFGVVDPMLDMSRHMLFPRGPAAFSADVKQKMFMARNVANITQTMLADWVVVWLPLYSEKTSHRRAHTRLDAVEMSYSGLAFQRRKDRKI